MTDRPDNLTPAPNQEFPPVGAIEGMDVVSAVSQGVGTELDSRIDAVASAEVEPSDPWALYGTLGTSTYREPRPTDMQIPQPATVEVKPVDTNPTEVEQPEEQPSKELLTKAELDVKLDRHAIKNILVDYPELLPATKEWGGELSERDRVELEERRADLQATLDAISELPEQLHFEPGITLVAGENGLGKSTLLQAIRIAVDLQSRYESYGHERWSFEEFMAKELEPKELERTLGGNNFQPLPSMLSVMIARHIQLPRFESTADHFYLDATVQNGRRGFVPNWASTESAKTEIDQDLTRGFSHGQLNRESIIGHLQRRKDVHEDEKRRGPREVGVGVVFMDEVESGMSPRNHRKLKSTLEDVLIDGSIALAATNSEVLYFDPTLPRIDLEHPELGIHKPTEHPEVYDLAEFR